MPTEALLFFFVYTGNPANANRADLIAVTHNIHKLKGLFSIITMPRHREADPAPVKGEEITIIAGSYSGHRAWKNDAKGTTAKMVYVIIDMGDGNELATRIKKKNIGPPVASPSSYEEAAVQQIAAVQYHLKKAAYHLAKCQIKDWDETCRLFMIMCLEAKLEQEELGPAAAYYNVQFNQDDMNA